VLTMLRATPGAAFAPFKRPRCADLPAGSRQCRRL